MTLDEYIKLVSPDKPLSDVKKLLLTTLFNNNGHFPTNWTGSSTLLELTNQKYFDRRLRELRDENGCDIETLHIDGEHQYRLKSATILTGNTRGYLSAKQKEELFQRSNFTCSVCGRQAKAGVRGIQADHKIPLKRGGSNSTENWQAICNECNVAKRRVCEGCKDDCASCGWAFPTNKGLPITIYVTQDEFDRLVLRTKNVSDFVKEMLLREL